MKIINLSKMIKYIFTLLFLVHGVLLSQSKTYLKLWYDSPAEEWEEALPIGNGRLGAMVFGNPSVEFIQLNENTIWGGQPHRNDNSEAKEALPLVRSLLFEGKYKEAQELVDQKFISKNSHGMPYQTAGNLILNFPGHEKYENYYRELNIENAVATTVYDVNNITYKREVFSSYPDQIILLRISANRNGKINFVASMNHPSEVEISTNSNKELILDGTTSDCNSIKGGVDFQTKVKIKNISGTIRSTDSSISVQNADTVDIYISIASSFINYQDISGNAEKINDEFLYNASKRTFEQSINDHINDYKNYFNRVSLHLGFSETANKATDTRISKFSDGNDPQLVELYFQYGRYLLISSSRPGGQPTNLQGIWNDKLYPPWESKYTVNINTEMNYWPSEPTNLTEMNEPLIQMVKDVSNTGRKTAVDMYGAKGWVLHHNTDIWRINGPVDGAFWGMWPMGGAWLCQHLFDKYEYNGDLEYLKSVYPIFRGAVEFYLSFLIEEPKNNWLVVSPSVSPENSPSIHPKYSLTYGTTMDNQLLLDLFTKTISAANMLGLDQEFVTSINKAIKKLPPMQVGQYGQLQEWIEDWDDPEDHHRHVSHLYGLFPSNQISPFRTPELFDAVRTSLIFRGDPSTGWSMNWKINLWAHLLDGNHAYKLMSEQITLVDTSNGKGGTYPNMFDAHPPFQIDGNFGFTSGVSEMLLQSNDDAIFLLPSLPDVWKAGIVKGLRAQGGFEIDEMEWKDGKIYKVTIKSNLGGNCRIRSYTKLASDGNFEIRAVTAGTKNKNKFYSVPELKMPSISNKAKKNALGIKETYVYDLETEGGNNYTLVLSD